MSASTSFGPVADAARSEPWSLRTRGSLAALAMTVFALVFSEFLPTGLLTPMATDLVTSPGAAGQTVTATAVAGMISALFIGLAVGNIDRKLVMIALASLALAGNAASILASDLPTLFGARIAVGIAIGGFWALSAGVVGRLVPSHDIGRAMGIIIIGVSVATIAAPPAGAFIAEHWGWRAAMATAAAACGIAILAQAATLPRLPASHGVQLTTLLAVSRRRVIVIGLLAVVAIAGGHFAGFTYIRPALQELAGLDATRLAAVLLSFGVSNFAGNLVAAGVVDRNLRTVLGGSAAMIGLSVLGMVAASQSPYLVVALVCAWGFAFGAAPIALQTWMARAAPDELESVGSLFIATFQVAIATGAAAGGAIVDRSGVAVVLIFAGTLTLSAVIAPMVSAPPPPTR